MKVRLKLGKTTPTEHLSVLGYALAEMAHTIAKYLGYNAMYIERSAMCTVARYRCFWNKTNVASKIVKLYLSFKINFSKMI